MREFSIVILCIFLVVDVMLAAKKRNLWAFLGWLISFILYTYLIVYYK